MYKRNRETLIYCFNMNNNSWFTITMMAKIAASIVFPDMFSRKMAAPNIVNANKTREGCCSRWFDFGAAKYAQSIIAVTGNMIISRYFNTVFSG